MLITDRDVRRAAVIRAAGFTVTTIKLSCSPRCAFEYQDAQETRKLIDDYEQRLIVAVPHKAVMSAHGELLSECRDLKSGRY